MKTCKTCNTEKPLEEFCRHSQVKGGYRRSCRACESIKRPKQSKKDNINRFTSYSHVWAEHAVNGAKTRAKKKNLNITITAIDLEELLCETNYKCIL